MADCLDTPYKIFDPVNWVKMGWWRNRSWCTVPASHELAPGRAAERLHVIILQLDSLRCQPVQSRGFDLWAVVPHIPEALVIHQDKDDVRLRARLVKLIASVAQLGVPTLPRQLNAPRLRNDEAEEQTQRDPQYVHVSARLRPPGAVTVGRWDGVCGRWRVAHVQWETAALWDRVRIVFSFSPP